MDGRPYACTHPERYAPLAREEIARMLPPQDPFCACRHDRAPLVRLGKVRHGNKVLYMLLCTACGFSVSTEELRHLWSHGRANKRSGAPVRGYGWAAHRAEEADAEEAETA